MKKLSVLYQVLGIESNSPSPSFTGSEIFQFQKSIELVLPDDLKEYFSILGDSKSQYNENLYRFFSLKDFKRISEELTSLDGIPDYSNIVNTLRDYKECFVFADYMYHMFSYAIRLHIKSAEKNEIYIICGDRYRIIANSFTEFIELYLSNSIKLQFED